MLFYYYYTVHCKWSSFSDCSKNEVWIAGFKRAATAAAPIFSSDFLQNVSVLTLKSQHFISSKKTTLKSPKEALTPPPHFSFDTIWVFEFCHNLSCHILSHWLFVKIWVLSQFEFFSLITIWVFEFHQNSSFWVSSYLSFWVSSQFEFLSFITIWIFEFYHNLSFWNSSQFEFLSFITIWVLSL